MNKNQINDYDDNDDYYNIKNTIENEDVEKMQFVINVIKFFILEIFIILIFLNVEIIFILIII